MRVPRTKVLSVRSVEHSGAHLQHADFFRISEGLDEADTLLLTQQALRVGQLRQVLEVLYVFLHTWVVAPGHNQMHALERVLWQCLAQHSQRLHRQCDVLLALESIDGQEHDVVVGVARRWSRAGGRGQHEVASERDTLGTGNVLDANITRTFRWR